jgi:hypothetical protein
MHDILMINVLLTLACFMGAPFMSISMLSFGIWLPEEMYNITYSHGFEKIGNIITYVIAGIPVWSTIITFSSFQLFIYGTSSFLAILIFFVLFTLMTLFTIKMSKVL